MANYQNYPTIVYENLKEMYHASAEAYGEKTLFMQKEEGVYREYSFRQYAEEVDALGTALCARGLMGKRILVSGENGYDWVRAYMAVICGVGVVVPVDKEIPAEEIANIANESEAAAILYSDKLAEKVEAIPSSVERICFTELPALIEDGRARIAAGDRTFLDAKIDAHAMSALLFTSGTTGVSKGVMLSHRNICFNLSEMCQMVYIDDKDVFLSVLPIHHAYECTCGFLCQVYRGSTVAFSEGLRHITRNMQEVHPTMILCVPLLLETMYRKVWANIRKQGMEKKVKLAIKVTNAIPNEALRLSAKKKVFAQIHKSFGGNLRIMISGGAAVDPKIMKGLRDLGIATYQGYGLTECAPLAALNRDTFYNDGSAGMATPNALLDVYDVQGDGTGEIRYKGDNIMLGYYKQPEMTAEVIRDGWFYTGDLGYLDKNGFLFITGRKKNVIVTSNGKNIFPEELETYLGRTPYVAESVVVGYMNPKKKDYDIVAIIRPDLDRFTEDYGTRYTQDQLETEMKKAISEVNGIVQSYKRIETYVLREEEFPKNTSRKIKRAGIADSAFEAYRKKVGI
ncbi:MAG: AMP-binding protein [Clostridia bacterium]|jgi:long-chain acyl-CoA synthetase|nr:AMP-binding protein [Clostridia bacterium]